MKKPSDRKGGSISPKKTPSKRPGNRIEGGQFVRILKKGREGRKRKIQSVSESTHYHDNARKRASFSPERSDYQSEYSNGMEAGNKEKGSTKKERRNHDDIKKKWRGWKEIEGLGGNAGRQDRRLELRRSGLTPVPALLTLEGS